MNEYVVNKLYEFHPANAFGTEDGGCRKVAHTSTHPASSELSCKSRASSELIVPGPYS